MPPNLDHVLETLEAAAERKTFRRMDFFEPYAKQEEFFDLGSTKRERLLMAGNQEGKTYAGAFEVSCHLTGEYPAWWLGRRFDKPVHGWAAGETSELVRDNVQRLLCGPPGVAEMFGSGMIPKENFIGDPSTARGIANAYDTVQIRHKSGGISLLQFKSYSQGVARFASATIDFIWWDEEPPEDVYGEGIARITATSGMMFMTFTPLKGVTKVVGRFLYEPSEDRSFVTMTIEDAKHIPIGERQKIIAGYPAHEREARVSGKPMLGEGRVFQTPEETIKETPLPLSLVPLYWPKLWCVDFGIGHPFAAVLITWDKDSDTVHVLHTIRMVGMSPLQHAVPMKAIAASVPVAWPHDGHQRDKGSGIELAAIYRAQQLPMLPGHATFLGGGNSVEAGIMEMDHRFATGRLRVGAHLGDFFEEYGLYHRKNGLIVKIRDDILSALRGGIMMLRYAKAVPLGNKIRRRDTTAMAQGLDFDLFAT